MINQIVLDDKVDIEIGIDLDGLLLDQAHLEDRRTAASHNRANRHQSNRHRANMISCLAPFDDNCQVMISSS